MLAEVGHRDGLAVVQRMAGGGDQEAVLVEQRGRAEFGCVERSVHHRHVELAADELEGQRARGRIEEYDVHLGILRLEGVEEGRDEPARRRTDDAGADGAGHDVAHRRNVRRQRRELVVDPAGALDDDSTLLGELGGRSVHEDHPELVLETGDVGADVRLHGVQRLRRCREAAVLADGDECSELSLVHVEACTFSRTGSERRSSLREILAIGCNYWKDCLQVFIVMPQQQTPEHSGVPPSQLWPRSSGGIPLCRRPSRRTRSPLWSFGLFHGRRPASLGTVAALPPDRSATSGGRPCRGTEFFQCRRFAPGTRVASSSWPLL